MIAPARSNEPIIINVADTYRSFLSFTLSTGFLGLLLTGLFTSFSLSPLGLLDLVVVAALAPDLGEVFAAADLPCLFGEALRPVVFFLTVIVQSYLGYNTQNTYEKNSLGATVNKRYATINLV